jgi:DNA-binding NtrC family response regulator
MALDSQRASLAGKRIFVVDDYPDLADVAKCVLESVGYRVDSFRERDRALGAFLCAEPRPALLITDYLGGPMSGIALVKACKAVDPGLKVLLVSGVDPRMLSPREWALVDGSLDKPYYPASLIEEVWRLCGKVSLAGEYESSESGTHQVSE